MGTINNVCATTCCCSLCCRRIPSNFAYFVLGSLFICLIFVTFRCNTATTAYLVEIEKPKLPPNRFAHMPGFIKDLFGVIEEEGKDTMQKVEYSSENKCKGGQNFDVLVLAAAISRCATHLRKEQVDVDLYLAAWDELNRFLHSMGKAFSFVSSDVTDKIGIMKEYRKGEDAGHYKTIDEMITYEKDNNIINYKDSPSKKVKASGSRTLLRLHRALKFLALLFDKLAKNTDGGKVSVMGYNAYHESPMAKYHPWLVQKAVGVAVYMLPDRTTFIQQMCQVKLSEDQLIDLMIEAAENMDSVFQYTHALYSKNEIMEIP